MFGFIPKEKKFFSMFQNMAGTIVSAALLLKEMLDNFSDPKSFANKIKDVEHQGDQITHTIINTLNESFITPFDHEDIYALASALDDILDLIDASAQRIVMYKIANTTAAAKELAFIIFKACQTVEKAIAKLEKEYKFIAEYCIEINSLENEGDRVSRDAISQLFENEKDPITLMKWKEIYEILEAAVDQCEDAANVLESLAVKNA